MPWSPVKRIVDATLSRFIPEQVRGSPDERQARLLVGILLLLVVTVPLSSVQVHDASPWFMVAAGVSVSMFVLALLVLRRWGSVRSAGFVYLIGASLITIPTVALRGFDTSAAVYLIIPSTVGMVVTSPRIGSFWALGTCVVAGIWAAMQHAGVGWQGTPTGVDGVLQPIFLGALYIVAATGSSEATARRALADADELNRALVRARDEAQRLAETRAQFLATMSHELRTPVNGVLGSVELLRDLPVSDVVREHISTMGISAAGLLAVVNDVLDLSKIEAGQLHIAPSPTRVATLVDHALRLAKVQARGQDVEFSATVSDGLPSLVRTDGARVGQILSNLLSNAIKFTEKGSIDVQVRVSGDHIEFAVRDTGPGIPADLLERIFEPFRQGDESLERRYGGTGLGLSISRRIARLLGGDLSVTSVVGEGSIFVATIALVSSAGDEPRDGTPPNAVIDARGLRILVVDDHPINRRVAAAMLSKWGATAETAVDGADAIARWRTDPNFDLVLMDWEMPGLHGGETTQRIRSLPGGDGVPIVALSAHVVNDFRQTCLDAGLDDYLPKPLIQADLARVLETTRAGRAAFVERRSAA